KIDIDVIKRIGRYQVPIELFQDVHVEVNTLVVPEGGELPSDEELAAMEAEERTEQEAEAVGEAPSELEAILAAEDRAEQEAEAAEASASAAADVEPETAPDAGTPEPTQETG